MRKTNIFCILTFVSSLNLFSVAWSNEYNLTTLEENEAPANSGALAPNAICPDVKSAGHSTENTDPKDYCYVYGKNPDNCSAGSLNASPYFNRVTKSTCNKTSDAKFCSLASDAIQRPIVGYVKYGNWQHFSQEETIRPITCN